MLMTVIFGLGLAFILGYYFGLIPAIVVGIIAFAICLAEVALIYKSRIPADTFRDMILQETDGSLPRRVIIQDPVYKTIKFDQTGDLVETQLGTYFMYGHPWEFPKKWLIINRLLPQQAARKLIIIQGVVQYMGNDTKYVETPNRLLDKKGAVVGYADLILMESAYDIINKTKRFTNEAITMNPKVIKNKLEKININDLNPPQY
ncbi:MAG: hypothetical protein ACYCS1_04350 [Gammaproteobacteria bacterium]